MDAVDAPRNTERESGRGNVIAEIISVRRTDSVDICRRLSRSLSIDCSDSPFSSFGGRTEICPASSLKLVVFADVSGPSEPIRTHLVTSQREAFVGQVVVRCAAIVAVFRCGDSYFTALL